MDKHQKTILLQHSNIQKFLQNTKNTTTQTTPQTSA